MPQSAQTIHPQLVADCHLLGTTASGTLLLSRNASLHWFILVPDSDQQDLLDLSPPLLASVMADCQSLSSLLKTALHYPKVNFAGLGNVVPQMHLHIIGRRPQDACWPQPVWGNLAAAGPDWNATALGQLKTLLCQRRVLLSGNSDG